MTYRRKTTRKVSKVVQVLNNTLRHVPYDQLVSSGFSEEEVTRELDRRDHLKEGDLGYRFFPSLNSINQASLFLSHHYIGDRSAGNNVGLVRWMRETCEEVWDEKELILPHIYRARYLGAYWFFKTNNDNDSVLLVGVSYVKEFTKLTQSFTVDKRIDITQHIINRVTLRMYELFLNACSGLGIVEWIQAIAVGSLNKLFAESGELEYDKYNFITAVNSPGCLTLVTVTEKNR